jgi:hypothetical protein
VEQPFACQIAMKLFHDGTLISHFFAKGRTDIGNGTRTKGQRSKNVELRIVLRFRVQGSGRASETNDNDD